VSGAEQHRRRNRRSRFGFVALLAVPAVVAVVAVVVLTRPDPGEPPRDLVVQLTTTTRAPVVPPTTVAPPHDVAVEPGDDLAALAREHPPGTVFWLRAGVYRMQSVEPRRGQVFVGESGAVLDGSTVLNGFVPTGDLWAVGGQTQGPGRSGGECVPGAPACGFPEMLYLDGAPLFQVAAKRHVRSGTWYFDYEDDTIYLGDDPAGHVVETSWVPHAFAGTEPDVEIRNLVVRKYASPPTFGAVRANGASGWVVADSEVAYNAGVGIQLDAGGRALGNFAHHNGEKGISARGRGAVIRGNEIAWNNNGGFDSQWAAGGAKFVLCEDLVVVDNHVHDNAGPGLWADIDCAGIRIEDNVVEDNAGPGIRVEISREALVRGNRLARNGTGWGPGISIASSSDVEVADNVLDEDTILAVHADRDDGRYGPRLLENLWVHDNTLAWTRGATGLIVAGRDDSFFTSRNNRFSGNEYRSLPSGTPFRWDDRELTFEAWQRAGNDVDGTTG
jgi:parallel beta-helix repeat protein